MRREKFHCPSTGNVEVDPGVQRPDSIDLIMHYAMMRCISNLKLQNILKNNNILPIEVLDSHHLR